MAYSQHHWWGDGVLTFIPDVSFFGHGLHKDHVAEWGTLQNDSLAFKDTRSGCQFKKRKKHLVISHGFFFKNEPLMNNFHARYYLESFSGSLVWKWTVNALRPVAIMSRGATISRCERQKSMTKFVAAKFNCRLFVGYVVANFFPRGWGEKRLFWQRSETSGFLTMLTVAMLGSNRSSKHGKNGDGLCNTVTSGKKIKSPESISPSTRQKKRSCNICKANLI